MVGAARPLPDDESRGAGDDHPAPHAAWEEEGVEAGGGGGGGGGHVGVL